MTRSIVLVLSIALAACATVPPPAPPVHAEVGVAFDRSEAYEGLGCVAAPIRNSGRAIGAVSVTGPIVRLDWDAMADAVLRAATNIWGARLNWQH